MKETGLMFKAPLVRAILSGQKTQTRRGLKQAVGPSLSVGIDDANPGVAELSWLYGDGAGHDVHESIKRVSCPFGQPGDRIYVRETVRSCRAYEVQGYPPSEWGNKPIWFEADGAPPGAASAWATKATPAIHMPKWAARIWLEITGVRVERLQAISEEDAKAEGVDATKYHGLDRAYARAFSELWESTGGDWAANPWVWVIDFKRIDQPAPKEAP